MNNKSTHTARAELANAIRRRNQLATGKQKRRILDEFAASAGYQVVFRDSGAMACSALQPFAFDYVKWPLLIAAWSRFLAVPRSFKYADLSGRARAPCLSRLAFWG